MILSGQKTKIYLAIPYTGMEEQSFTEANKIAAELMLQGYIVYSPISHCHPISAWTGSQDEAFWLAQDFSFISWCDILLICDHLATWDASSGVKKEITEASRLKKRILFYSIYKKELSNANRETQDENRQPIWPTER